MKPAHTFTVLSLAFLAFSFSIYLEPALDAAPSTNPEKQMASEGRLVWQRYNCQSCHQLYGLGGYLGPDLTNIYSAPGKGETWIRAMLKVGSAPMPSFTMPEEEIAALLAFLKATDASGRADPKDFVALPTGMIQRK
ncbi:MAG: cytochrome c [Haliscomenobacteraceae bacterium CHB4]|nr:hypothetical protein [Saprospiraceae bacterium]MCE7924570.1 cytochrome c [Haliscomenobacteraceae bacterium CHB4]